MFKRKCGPDFFAHCGGGGESHSSTTCWSSASDASTLGTEIWPLKAPSKSAVAYSSSAIDKEMVKELNQLSINDRQKVYEDIHGVADGIQETPELVLESMQDLFQCIQKIRKRSAYEKAIFLSPSYVKDPAFCLQFLRADNFHPRNAAKRMVAYFEMKYELFGLDALVRDLTIEEDIDETVMSLLKRGIVQLLPSTDSVGRSVVMIFFKQASDDYTPIQISQMSTYMFEKVHKLNPRPEKGVVMVMFESVDSGTHPSFSLDRVQEATRFFSAFPLNAKAWHVCYNDVHSMPTMELFKMAMGTSGRIRVRSFFGKDTECRYHLMTFGIPTSDIPVTYDGSLDLRPHSLFLERQRQAEHPQVACRRLHPPPYPTSVDVVFGKGQPFQQHEGNLRMHEVVTKYFHEYNGISRKDAQLLFQRVAAELNQAGTRFLRKTDDGEQWAQVDDREAHKKISAAFRNKALQLAKEGE